MIVAELEGVTKAFGRVRALQGVSFGVRTGEVVALLGANGAGKTTAISMLLGLRRPDTGAARVFGADPRAPRSRRGLGATPQESAFPATLRVRELVSLVSAHYREPESAESLLGRFLLRELAPRQVGGLSGGERRRLGVALAFAGRPGLVILDEPTAGLDSEARHSVWSAVRAHASGGGSLLLTTHHLGEADALASRVVLLEAGRVAADGAIAALKAAAGTFVVRFLADDGVPVAGATRDGPFLELRTRDSRATVECLLRAGVLLEGLEVRLLTLEEALAVERARP